MGLSIKNVNGMAGLEFGAWNLEFRLDDFDDVI